MSRVKCDIINDNNFNYNKFKENVLNDIDSIPNYLIQNINKDAILYKNLLNNNFTLLNISKLKIDEGMYVDGYHYTPLFNKKIAQEIYSYLDKNF